MVRINNEIEIISFVLMTYIRIAVLAPLEVRLIALEIFVKQKRRQKEYLDNVYNWCKDCIGNTGGAIC